MLCVEGCGTEGVEDWCVEGCKGLGCRGLVCRVWMVHRVGVQRVWTV